MRRPDPSRPTALVLSAVAALEVGVVAYVALVAWRSPDITAEPMWQGVWLAIELALLRAVWKRSAVALYVLYGLIAIPALLLLATSIAVEAFVVVLLVVALVELVLLASPPVRTHVRRTDPTHSESEPTQAQR